MCVNRGDLPETGLRGGPCPPSRHFRTHRIECFWPVDIVRVSVADRGCARRQLPENP